MANVCTSPPTKTQDFLDFGKLKRRHTNKLGSYYLEWMGKTFSPSEPWWKAVSTKKSNVHDLLFRLKSCSRKRDLQEGRRVHANAVETGNGSNIFVAAALINMYAKCRSMVDARQVFNNVEKPDVVCWTALILGYAGNWEGEAALNLFSWMKATHGCVLDSFTYVAAIKSCTSLAACEAGKAECLKRGREIHMEIGLHMNHVLQNALIKMYAKSGSMVEARRVFDNINGPNVVAWTALIVGYTDNGEGLAALDTFRRMKDACECAPDSFTYVAAIKACTCLAADDDKKRECLKRAREIHFEIGHHMDHFVQSTLINLYAKCGSMVDAKRVFDSIEQPNVVSWTALILGYADKGEGRSALELFYRMRSECGCAPDFVTYVAAIKACTSLVADEAGKRECLKWGREIHWGIGDHMNRVLQNTLINMYAKCGSMVDARQVFDSIEPDVVSWNALILGYADNGEGRVALDLFSWMKATRGYTPNSVTYVAAVKACTSLAADEAGKGECLKRGRKIHLEVGYHMDRFLQSLLINMYSKCGCMADAALVFDGVEDPDLASWNVLILGYAENGLGQAALDCFYRMKAAGGCAPNSMTYVAALKACACIGALAVGRKLHLEITDFSVHYIVTCLVDFYAKCGSMLEAQEMFDLHSSSRNIATWNALLAGYGRFGDSDSVFEHFESMQEQRFQPNAVTFVSMLLCCTHAGLVEKARDYLEAMPGQYGVTPTVMHYTCMVDVLGRANRLDEAVALLNKMPCNPNAVSWMTLLGACRKWKNVDIGRLAFSLSKKNASAYLLMAEIYGSRGMRKEQESILETRWKADDAWKLAGQAYVIDGLGKMVTFVVGDDDRPEVKQKLKQYLEAMKEHGYVAESYSIVVDTEKENSLCSHSERRAVLYGILNTPPDEPVRTFKNKRMCGDCHSAIKMFSKFSRRVIIVRDENRFHVMENGNCACEEYW